MDTIAMTSMNDDDTLMDGHVDYHRIGDALTYLVDNFQDQPALDDVAAQIGLSPHHFQRLFSRWVGLSPKKFLQVLTIEEAKRSLDESNNVMNAAFDAGLSGPGRLHDLFVAHESITPGEYKALGKGLTIRYGFHNGPFGETLLLVADKGLCGLAFVDDRGKQACFEDVAGRWSLAHLVEDQAATQPVMDGIFRRPGETSQTTVSPLRLLLKGTDFQIRVWQALMSIPPGALVTYGRVAEGIGMKQAAARAVGTAVGMNPISWLIPCHRVIRNSGALGGYHWGLQRKLAMLTWEKNGLPAPQGGQLVN